MPDPGPSAIGSDARWRGIVMHPAVLLFGLVILLDLAWSAFSSSTAPAEFALIDEPAHLAAALVLLIALAAVVERPLTPTFIAAALVASVAIDVDHIPAYLGWHGLTEGTPRPYTHSLITPLLLALAGEFTHGRSRQIAWGAAFGVCAHFLRDACTGPGLPVLWPASSATVRAPYVLFALGVALAAALAATYPGPRTR